MGESRDWAGLMLAQMTLCETCVVTDLLGDLGPRRDTREFTVRRERAAVKACPARIDRLEVPSGAGCRSMQLRGRTLCQLALDQRDR
jgi:hypothetical protein